MEKVVLKLGEYWINEFGKLVAMDASGNSKPVFIFYVQHKMECWNQHQRRLFRGTDPGDVWVEETENMLELFFIPFMLCFFYGECGPCFLADRG
ncbi:MAG: hypothetical protein Q4F92_03545 [Acidaminococcus sp.]|uniref:hypothetical protein n=1 Tax=Acidaminococcus sp. TaxID=1872103 RepID=UPI0026E0ACC3|nr:hypothetical protein [Acidaminococcus sp.]MDO5597403.1 hypothetical protein [Acidaminococcus sp.]